MARTTYQRDQSGTQSLLGWSSSEPMTFYVVKGEGDSLVAPFVREFECALRQAALRRSAGYPVVIEEWEWRHDWDESSFVCSR
jgi:hypothetical protein